MDIFKAINENDLEKVKLIVQPGFDINQTEKEYGRTPLMEASNYGYLEIVQFLVDIRKADLNKAEDYGRTALMLASMRGHLEIVQFLVQNYADLTQTDNYGQTALTIAYNYGYSGIIKYLKKIEFIIKIIRAFHRSPEYAAWRYHPKKMKKEGFFDLDYEKGVHS